VAAPRVLVFGIGFLTVLRGTEGGDLVAEGLILGQECQRTGAAALGGDIAAFVSVSIAGLVISYSVKDAADATAIVTTADVFDTWGVGTVIIFLNTGAAAVDYLCRDATGSGFIP